jgi:hypothetical protein
MQTTYPRGRVSNETLMVMGPSRLWSLSNVHCKIQTRPLIKEGALHEDESKCQTKENLKLGHGPQRAARHRDELADWPSVADSTSQSSEPDRMTDFTRNSRHTLCQLHANDTLRMVQGHRDAVPLPLVQEPKPGKTSGNLLCK